MKRRSALVNFAHGCIALATALAGANSKAQRVANPINPPSRLGGPPGPGHFPRASEGINRAQPPAVYVVRAVNDRDNIVRLSDGEGRTEEVHVRPHVFDVSELKPGDEIVVDFVMPHGSGSRFEAAHLWIR